MSDIKMSDVFDLPLYADVTGVIFDNYSCAIGEICGTLKQSKYAAHAISTHDAMQARIVELEKALTNIKNHQETVIVGMPELSATWQIASRALEK